MTRAIAALTCVCTFAVGCGVDFTQTADDGSRRGPANVGGTMLEDPLSTPARNESPADTGEPAPDDSAIDQPPADDPGEVGLAEGEAPEGTVRERAETGAGRKGRYEGSGLVVTPLKAYFSAQQRIVYEIQIPHAMQLFRATNDRFPRDQEVFMQQIIRANAIQLPELPPDHRYLYDAKKGELMVERPQ